MSVRTSKANSGIVHAGHDAKPDTLKAKLNVQGNLMMEEMAKKLDFPFKRNGSLVVCQNEEELSKLEELKERGKENGVEGLRILTREEALELEPALADSVYAALYAPTGGIVCPFLMNIAYAENAAINGVKFQFETCVRDIQRCHQVSGFEVITNQGTLYSKYVINAAGVYADEINNQLSDRKLHITARKGEYMLLDKTVGDYVKSTIFQLPSKMGKGVLVTPTVHGNLLVGPTAVNVEDKGAVNTTMNGLDQIARVSSHSVKNVPLRQVITSFAGLRAHEDGDDFVIGESEDVKGLINAAGIESPGLSSAPAIGVTVAELVRDLLNAEEKSDFNPVRHGILDPDTLSLEDRNQLIKEKPAYGNIICRCEMITEGEILDAIHRSLGARSLDGVKRRTRAGMGRCQSGFCSPKVMEILEREVPMPVSKIGKNGVGSEFIVGENKELS